MIQLRSIHIRNPDALPDGFPFDVPVVRSLDEVEFTAPVTILVGENGSGKSTLLEAIGSSASLPTIGAVSIDRDETLAAAHDLARTSSSPGTSAATVASTSAPRISSASPSAPTAPSAN